MLLFQILSKVLNKIKCLIVIRVLNSMKIHNSLSNTKNIQSMKTNIPWNKIKIHTCTLWKIYVENYINSRLSSLKTLSICYHSQSKSSLKKKSITLRELSIRKNWERSSRWNNDCLSIFDLYISLSFQKIWHISYTFPISKYQTILYRFQISIVLILIFFQIIK